MLFLDVKVKATLEKVRIDLVLKNDTHSTVKLEFPTSQLYDYTIINDQGVEVFRYSKGRYFLQAFHYMTLKEKEEKTLRSTWDYKVNGERVESGAYTLTATLLPANISQLPPASLAKTKKFVIPALNK